MNYTKPEVAVLGQAVNVIEHSTQKGNVVATDAPGLKQTLPIPAYDLD
jgi:hypothetical protein